jgi:hypothetical protein
VQKVSGMPPRRLDTVCSGLIAQNAADGAGWDKLVVTSGGANLRALSPNNGIVMDSSLFSGYFQPYVDQVWSKYSSESLTVDTQASYGSVSGTVSGGQLNFSGAGSFAQPTTADIFSCSTGPFANTAGEMGPLVARISAAFNRTTLLTDTDQPDGENPANYYKNSITNHYARIVHAANLDGLGYAFPYDDVTPNGGVNQSGACPTRAARRCGRSRSAAARPPAPRRPTASASPTAATSGGGGTGHGQRVLDDPGLVLQRPQRHPERDDQRHRRRPGRRLHRQRLLARL